MYKVPEEWKLSDFLELSNDEKLKWLYNGVKNGGGGGGESDIFELKFIATYSNENDSYSVTANKTYAELRTALEAEKNIVATLSFSNQNFIDKCVTYSVWPTSVSFTFIAPFAVDWEIDVTDITFSASEINYVGTYYKQNTYSLAVIPGDYGNGDELADEFIAMYWYCQDQGTPILMTVSDNGYYATFIYQQNYGWKWLSGDSELNGATVEIDSGGFVSVTMPN